MLYRKRLLSSRGGCLKSFLRSKIAPYARVYAIGGKLYDDDIFLVLNRVFHRIILFRKNLKIVIDERKTEVVIYL